MSRQLPTHPDLDHLKKQAKDLLGHLRRQNPAAQLTDAQYALAREYGFSSWATLRAQVASAQSGDAQTIDEPPRNPQEPSPFAGRWVANVSKSRRHPSQQFQRAMLEIGVAGNTVTILDTVVDEAGREERHTNTIEADGGDRIADGGNGHVLTVRWRGSRMLETMARKDGKVVGRGAYEVSADGATLTVSGDQQMVVFERA